MKFDFTDKKTYLAWRQEWREEYVALSKKIREIKRRRKQFLNHYERHMTPQGRVRQLVSREPNPEYGDTSWLQDLRLRASMEMERLKEARDLSWQLKQERLSREIAA